MDVQGRRSTYSRKPRKLSKADKRLTATTMTPIIVFLVALPFAYGSIDASVTTSAASTTTVSASSSIHTVDVGEGGFTFNPDTLTVSPGGKVEFHFYPQNHSVAQASFDNPCHPMNTSSFSSGFVSTTKESVRNPGIEIRIASNANRKPSLP